MNRMPPAAPAELKESFPASFVIKAATKLAIEQDKAILLDYYMDTKLGHAFIGEDIETKDKFLVKNPEEYTSPIQKMFKAKDDYIVVTENSIYIVSGQLKKKRIIATT